MIVLDANVVIAFLDDRDAHHGRALDLLESNAMHEFACSALTVAEVLVHPTRSNDQDAAIAALRRIGLQIVPIEASHAPELARVRSQYGLRMPDAVVLHAAISSSASLMTFDESLARAADRAGVAVAVVVEEP